MRKDMKIMVNALLIGVRATLLTALVVWIAIELERAGMIVFPVWVKWVVSLIVFWVYGEYLAKPLFQVLKDRARRKKWEEMKKGYESR